MNAWCVEVTWRDYADGEESTSLYGPFRSPDTAAKHAEKIETALPDPGDAGSISVVARPLGEPLIRPVVAEAKRWIEEISAQIDHGGSS